MIRFSKHKTTLLTAISFHTLTLNFYIHCRPIAKSLQTDSIHR